MKKMSGLRGRQIEKALYEGYQLCDSQDGIIRLACHAGISRVLKHLREQSPSLDGTGTGRDAAIISGERWCDKTYKDLNRQIVCKTGVRAAVFEFERNPGLAGRHKKRR